MNKTGVCSPLTRRTFLGAAALASCVQAAEPKQQFPADISHRLSVSTYPFRSMIAAPGKTPATKADGKPIVTLQEFAGTVAKDFGVYGIEPWSRHFESIDPDYLKGLRQAFDRAGLRTVNIPCDVPVKPCGSPLESMAALDTWSQWVDAAAILGSPSIRVHVPGEGEEITCAVTSLTAIAEYGETKNIVINLENDSPRSEGPYRVLKIIEAVNSPFLRALPDFCNSMQIRNDQAENSRALALLFPHAYNISHVKDSEVVDGKELRVDVDPIFTIAKTAGYQGYFSMETEGSQDPYTGTRNLIAAARRNLA